MTVNRCGPLLEVSTVPVHDSPFKVGVHAPCTPVLCVQLAAVRYGPVGLVAGLEVVGLLQLYDAVTDWPLV